MTPTRPAHQQILVTGSAILEAFRQSGDSLAGRFFNHRLNPLSMAELAHSNDKELDLLIRRGGFPEPFLAESDDDVNRWRLHYNYINVMIRTDILDFERIHDFKVMQITLDLLRHRVDRLFHTRRWPETPNVRQIRLNDICRSWSLFSLCFEYHRITEISTVPC